MHILKIIIFLGLLYLGATKGYAYLEGEGYFDSKPSDEAFIAGTGQNPTNADKRQDSPL